MSLTKPHSHLMYKYPLMSSIAETPLAIFQCHHVSFNESNYLLMLSSNLMRDTFKDQRAATEKTDLSIEHLLFFFSYLTG